MGSFEGSPCKKIRTIMTIYPELFTFIVNRATKIKKIHDIKDKIISIGPKGKWYPRYGRDALCTGKAA